MEAYDARAHREHERQDRVNTRTNLQDGQSSKEYLKLVTCLFLIPILARSVVHVSALRRDWPRPLSLEGRASVPGRVPWEELSLEEGHEDAFKDKLDVCSH